MNRRLDGFAIGCLALLAAAAIPAHAERGAVVSRIDHFVAEDNQAAGLFTLFTDQFRLPTIWPMSSYGSTQSGGGYFGNVVIEVARFGNDAGGGHAQWAGIVFAPVESADASVEELNRPQIDHGPPIPYPSKPRAEGPDQTLWTTVRVRDLGVPGLGIVICDYHFDTSTGLAAAAAELNRQQGGPLGLLGVKNVLIEASHLSDARARWRKVLAPAAAVESDTFRFKSGPAIQLVSGKRDVIRAITLEVSSLARAKAFLTDKSIAYDIAGPELVLREGIHDLAVRIVQRSTGDTAVK
jgi:hypothetical protein